MKPRLLAFTLLVIALLLVGLMPAAAQTATPQPPAAPPAPARPRSRPDYRPPAPAAERIRGPRDDAPLPAPEEAGDPRLAARRAQRQAERQARRTAALAAPPSYQGGPSLPITAGPERIPAAVLPDDNDPSYNSSISVDGRYTAFQSSAGNLVAGDDDGGLPDVFVYDNDSGQTALVSVPLGGDAIYGFFYDPSISDDGRYVAFSGWTYDLVPTEEMWTSDIYVVDRDDGSVIRVSDAYDGSEADNNSYAPVISPDGGHVAFYSYATNLVDDDANGLVDVFLHDIDAGVTVRVSVSSSEAEADDESYLGGVSSGGQFVSFYSYAANLVANDTNDLSDTFVRDVAGGVTERVSVADGAPGAQANNGSWTGDISANGRYVVFESYADNLVASDDNNNSDIFVRDRLNDSTILVSLDENGDRTDYYSYDPSIAGDGETVAFTTYSALVAGDANGDEDVYVIDWISVGVVRASVDSGGGEPDSYSYGAALSADASTVVFTSDAGDLVAGDDNAADDVFRRALPGGPTTLVSADAFPLTEPSGDSYEPSLSADGRYVAFISDASNLTPGNSGGYYHLYHYDRQLDEVTLASIGLWNDYAYGDSEALDISDDGNRIAFASWAWNLVEDDTNDETDIFVYDHAAGTTTRVNVDSAGNESIGWSHDPAISGDGNVVAFRSEADNLVAGDNNGVGDVFVRDLTTGETTRVSVSSGGDEGNDESYSPVLSANGRYVAFESLANNFVDNDYNSYSDIYVHDRNTGETTLVSVGIWDEAAWYGSHSPSISANGQYVAFGSRSNEHVPDDENWADDIFLRDLWAGATAKVSHAPDGGPTIDPSWAPQLSADGRFVAYLSQAVNLVPDDTNSEQDAFLYDRLTGETARLSESAGGVEGDSYSYQPTISADGTTAAFASRATNLVSGDSFGYTDVFVVEQDIAAPVLYSISGTIANDLGNLLEGTIVAPVDAPGNFAVSDENGEYTLWLPAGTYELAAERVEYRFVPTTQSVSVGPNRTGIDFTGYYDNFRLATYYVTEDAYVDQAKRGANFGSASILRVKNAAADMNAYVKFEVDGLDAAPGTCRTYGHTYLRTYVKEPSTSGGAVYAVANNWSENTLNWNNAPLITGAPVGDFGAVTDEQFASAVLSYPVESDGTYSFAIRNSSNNSVDYSSWEGGVYAVLGVNYLQDTSRQPVAYMDFTNRYGVAPLTVQFLSTASEGCPTSWHWDFGDGSSSTERDPIHTFNAIGDYDVTLTVTNGYGSDSTTETLHAVGLPTRYYVSPAANATIGGMPVQGADILLYDKPTNQWSMVYDGSDHSTTKNVTAFAFEGEDLLLVFAANQPIPGLGTATPRDIVRFTPNDPDTYPLGAGVFSWYRRGNGPGVGLTTKTEAIDALDEQPWSDYLSTVGAVALPTSPALKAADEDVMEWYNWAGGWAGALALDGSLIPGLAAEDINGLWYDDNGDYYITVVGSFNVGGVSGTGKNILRLHKQLDGTWSAFNVPWLAPGAVFPTTIDAIELSR